MEKLGINVQKSSNRTASNRIFLAAVGMFIACHMNLRAWYNRRGWFCPTCFTLLLRYRGHQGEPAAILATARASGQEFSPEIGWVDGEWQNRWFDLS